MKETYEFLKIRTKVNYLATNNGDKLVIDHLETQFYLMIKFIF